MAAAKPDLGKVGVTWEGEFSAEKTYERMSVVSYNGGLYISFASETTGGNPEADKDKWAVCIPPVMGESVVRFDDVTETVPVSISNMKSGSPLKNLIAHIKAFMTGGKVLWDACVTTGMITHQNINNQSKIPSAALLYALNKSLTDSVSAINSNLHCYIGFPDGVDGSNTMEEIINAAKPGITILPTNYACNAYSPTGIEGLFGFMIVKPIAVGNWNWYTIVLAYDNYEGILYAYSSRAHNTWKKINS